ncbi:MAG: ImmA/IrrE family metallo-endopeptidase [Dermatophilaceae bacterium]
MTSAKFIAERQASALIDCLDARQGITEVQIGRLPRVRIERDRLPTSGLSYWNGIDWVIVLNEDESPERQRFSLLHEYKHIIDHGRQHILYRTESEAERIADYFAGCALMPKRELKHVFCTLTQDLGQIAAYFNVSLAAVRVRLEQTGLVDGGTFTRTPRCARPIRTPQFRNQRFRPVPITRSYS